MLKSIAGSIRPASGNIKICGYQIGQINSYSKYTRMVQNMIIVQ
ncbi:hypothetical protein [Clostridium polyendosporum]